MKVHSKIDLLNILIFLGYVVALALPFFTFGFNIWYLCLCVIVVAFIGIINFGTTYKLLENELKVKNGIIGFTISYDKIKSITKVKRYFASSSTAIKCVMLEVKYDNIKTTYIYISPSSEDKFLNELLNKFESVCEIYDKRGKKK